MAAHTGSELVAAAMAAVMAFFGALGAAIKFWPDKPEKGNTDVLTQKVLDMERRQNVMDERIDDVFHLLGDIQRSMATCQSDIREALTRLQERRK